MGFDAGCVRFRVPFPTTTPHSMIVFSLSTCSPCTKIVCLCAKSRRWRALDIKQIPSHGTRSSSDWHLVVVFSRATRQQHTRNFRVHFLELRLKTGPYMG